MNEKTLILIRHAHREKNNPDEDNGLSKKGQEQARLLARHFKGRLEKCDVYFLTSPKQRCVDTIEAISDAVKKVAKRSNPPKVENLLGEGPDLPGRAERFYAWWRNEAPDLVVACSHGDWIPTFVQSTVGIDIPLKKAAYIQLQLVGSKVILSWLMQRVD